MKIIQCLSDIEFQKVDLPLSLRTAMEQDFLGLYESLNHDNTYLLNFRLPLMQALFVLEKDDDVIGKFNDPIALKFVEKVEIDETEYYRCGLRNGPYIQLYYSLVNSHNTEIEEWLRKHAEWNKGFDINV